MKCFHPTDKLSASLQIQLPLSIALFTQGISGGMECTALAVGPLLSGTISNYSSWRISSYIIIPIAGVNILAIWLFVKNLPQPEHANLRAKERWRQPDPLGIFLFVPMTVCLIPALQFGGSVYAWGNARIIVLFVLAGTLAIAFFIAQRRAGDKAMFLLHLLRQRSVTFG
jgi:MFS family permease